MESGTANLAINSVTGYKNVDGNIEEMSSNAEAAKNADQGDPDTSFDVPTDGFGYYLVFKQNGEFKYSGNRTLKFTEYEGAYANPTRAFISSATIASSDQFQIRHYGYNESTRKTINAILNITTFAGAGAGLVEDSDTDIELVTGGSYRVWLDYAKMNLGFESLQSIQPNYDAKEKDNVAQVDMDVISARTGNSGSSPKNRTSQSYKFYFSMPSYGDSNSPKIHYWGETETTWDTRPSMTFAFSNWYEEEVYSFNLPSGIDGLIITFTQQGDLKQSRDITNLPDSNTFAYSLSSWPGSLWTEGTWSIKNSTFEYVGNGADSGSVPSGSFIADKKNCYTVAANGFVRSGYTFAGWNTSSDGSGVSYSAGSPLTQSQCEALSSGTTTLYAQWHKNNGFYLLGTGLRKGDSGNYSDNWNIDGAIPADDLSETGLPVWSNIYINDTSEYSSNDQGFKVVYIYNGAIKSEDYKSSSLAGNHIYLDGGGGNNITCSQAAGPYTISFNSSNNNFTASLAVDVQCYEVKFSNGTKISSTSKETYSTNTDTALNPANIEIFSAPTGYGSVAGFYTDESCTASWNSSDAPTPGTKIYAKYNANNFQVTFKRNWNNGDETNVTGSPKTVYYDSKYVLLSGPSRTGYTFAGWFTERSGGTQITASTTVALSADQTLYAQWTPNIYEITLDNQSADSSGDTSIYELYADGYYLDSDCSANKMSTSTNGITVPTKTGYIFGGYYTEENGEGTQYIGSNGKLTNNASSTNFDDEGVLYAKWTPDSYIVTLNSNGVDSGHEGQTSVTATYNSEMPSIEGHLPTRDGYAFDGYYTSNDEGKTFGTKYYNADGTSAANWTTAGGATLYAKWVVWTITIGYSGNGNTGGSEPASSYTGSRTVGVSVDIASNTYTKTGYDFAGWSIMVGGSSHGTIRANDSSHTFTVAEAVTNGSTVTLTAIWTAKTTTVTLDMQNGSGGTSSVTATYDSAMPSATMPTRTGYTFGGYFAGENGTGTNYYSANGSSANDWDVEDNTKTLYAKWTANTYSITLSATNANNDYSTEPSSKATFDSEMPAISVLPTRTGYQFDGYYTSSSVQYYTSSGASALNWDIASATTLYARWSPLAYAITLDDNGGTGGLTKPVGNSGKATYDATMPSLGSPATLPTRTGYSFTGYFTSGGVQYYDSDGSSYQNWNIASATTLYAHWSVITYTISYDLAGGSASNPTSYKVESADITLNNPTRTGYAFAGWTGTDLVEATITVTIASGSIGNRSYTATWSANTYTVSFDFTSGSGGSSSATATYNADMPAITLPSRANYTFDGYWTTASGDGVKYYNANGSSAKNWDKTNDTTILYARWLATNGFYLRGSGLSLDGENYSSGWNYDDCIAANAGTSSSPSWEGIFIANNAQFKVYKVSGNNPNDNAGYYNLGISGTGASSWFNMSDTNFHCISDGTYNISYTDNDSTAEFIKVIVLTFSANGGEAGTLSRLTITSGTTLSALTNAQLPTKQNSYFGGFWVCSDAGATFTKVYYDFSGTVINGNDFTENTTLYARWYTDSQCFHAGETYYLIPNAAWRQDNAEFAAYLFTDSAGNEVTKWVEMTQIGNSGVYTLTLASGVYERIIFARMSEGDGASEDWDNRLAQTANLSKNSEKHYYKIGLDQSKTAVEPAATGEWLTIVPYLGGEEIYLLPDANWKANNAGFAIFLFGGSSDTWLTLTQVVDEEGGGVSDYFSATLTGNSSTHQWSGAIFVRYNVNAGSPSWSNYWNQTDNLYRTLSTQVCYAITNSSSSPADGEWHEFTNRDPGYYLVGQSETTGSTFYNMGWNLTNAIAADNNTIQPNLANWTGVAIKNNDLFKIVRVAGKIPYYYGYYSGGSQNLTGFLDTNQGNGSDIKSIHDCVATVYFNSSYRPFVSVTEFDSTATVATYSSLTKNSTSVTTSADSFSITVQVSSTTITGISSNSQATAQYCTLSLYSKTSAWNAESAVSSSISASNQAFYAIYIRDQVTITIKGSSDSTDLGTLATIVHDKDATGGETTYDLGSEVKTYGDSATGELSAYDKDGEDIQLYTNVACSSAYSGALTADVTVYLPVTKRVSKTIYVEAAYSSYTVESEAGLWSQIHITNTTGSDYFASDANSSWRVSINLYRIIVPTSWDFRIGNGFGDTGGHNFTQIINLDNSGTSTYLFIRAFQNANHPIVWCTEKTVAGVGTATIYKNNTQVGTMSYADWSTNFFMYESGLAMATGDTVHVVVAGTGIDALNGTYKRSRVIGNPGWFIKGTASANSGYSFKINGGDSFAMQVNPSNENEVMAVGISLTAGQTLTFFHNGESFAFTARPDSGNKYTTSAVESGMFDFYLDISKNSENLWVAENENPSAIDLIADSDLNLNLYIYKEGNNYYLSLAAVPSLGNGYYLMKTAENGGTTSGYRNGVKMITNSTGASYGHYYALSGDNIYARSYIHSEETPITVVNRSAEGVGTDATANSANGYITIVTTGYYSFVVVDNTLFIYGYDSSSFFKLNELNLNGDSSTIYSQQTALILEIEFTIDNNAPMSFSLNVTNPLSDFVGCRLVISNTKIASSVYGTIRGSENDYLTRLSSNSVISGSGTLSTVSARGSSTGYAYILIDYMDTDIDVTAYGQALSFVLVATQA